MNVVPGLRVLLGLVALSCVGSCDLGDEWYDTSPLVIRLADGPVDDALAVVIQVDGVDTDDLPFKFSPPLKVDLLDNSDGRSTILVDWDEAFVDSYERMKLKISAGLLGQDSWIDTATGRHALFLPESNRDGLTIKTKYKVPRKGVADFTIDFDLRQSVIPPVSAGAPYLLDPVLRLVETAKAGAIEGIVAGDTAQAPGCVPVVYAFVGNNVVPDDIDRSAPEPVTEATVRLDTVTGDFRYVLAHLPSGDYTVALTCQGDLDRPDRDDSAAVTFAAPRQVFVATSQRVRLDLP